MIVISIDTSTDVCSAALSVGGIPVASRIQAGGNNHASRLPVFVDELLAEMRERGLKLEAVALSIGPGSYTGLRIGTSLAKGLCYGYGVPLIPIPTTEVLCASFAAQSSVVSPESVLCPMIDARRMEVYTALYDTNIQAQSEVCAMVVDTDSFAPLLAEKDVYFFGDGTAKCQSVISSGKAHFVDAICPDAQYMGVLSEQESRSRIAGADLAYFDPLYVKEFVAAPSHVKGLV